MKIDDETDAPLLLTLKETAAMLRVSERTVRNLVAREKLRPVTWCRHLLIPHDQVHALAQATR